MLSDLLACNLDVLTRISWAVLQCCAKIFLLYGTDVQTVYLKLRALLDRASKQKTHPRASTNLHVNSGLLYGLIDRRA